MDKIFSRFAGRIAFWAGKPVVFGVAALAMVVWAAIGPFVGYSEIWQLSVNTGTTIITFLMVFVIQNSQNRDSAAIQIKLDELIRVSEGSPDALFDLENMPLNELEALRREYIASATKGRQVKSKAPGRKPAG